MSDSTKPNPRRRPDFTPDFFGENQHELVAKFAYEHWHARGSPLGSPEADWFAAENALYEWLVSRGTIDEGVDEGPSVESALYE